MNCKLSLYTLLLLICLGTSSAVAQEKDSPSTFFRVVPLNYTVASEVAEIIYQSMAHENSGLNVVADVRGNSIILSGSGTFQLEQVLEMVKSLDVAPRETPSEASELKVIQLVHMDPAQAFRILQSMIDGHGLRMDVDEVKSQVFVSGPPEELAIIEALLKRLDEPASDGGIEPLENIFVSATMIVESSEMSEDEAAVLKTPSPRTKALLDRAVAAQLVTFEDPRVVTSVVTHVRCAMPVTSDGGASVRQGSPTGKFDNSSQALAAGYDVTHYGNLTQLTNDKLQLNSTVEIRVRGNQFRDEIVSDIQSDIVARLNHPVLLSFSTIGDRDSAIIVELKSVE